MFTKRTFVVVLATFLASSGAFAQTEGDLSVAIVPTKAKGGPNLKGQLRKRVEKPLKKKGMRLVPFGAYRKAGKRAGVKGKAVYQAENAVKVGTEAGVTHVVVIEGQVEKQQDGRRKKKVFFASLTIFSVSSGEVVFTNRYELKGRRITGALGTTIVDEIVGVVNMPEEPPEAPEPIEEETPVEEPPEPPPVVAGIEGESGVGEDTVGGAMEPVDSSSEGLSAESGTEAPGVLASLDATPLSSDSLAVSVTEPAPRRRGKSWRPALHLGVGGVYVQRNATISASSGPPPPAYEGPSAGAHLRLNFYPFSIGGKGDFIEGLGLHLEATYLRAETDLGPPDNEVVASDIVDANGGLSLRIVFWESVTAPDAVINLGYGYLAFPLKKGVFPGARYHGPYLGATFTVPFLEEVGLVLGGHFMPRVTVDGKLKRLGRPRKQKNWPMGFRAEGGVRLFFDPFEIKLLGRMEQFNSAYRGETDLEGSVSQFLDVSMVDRMLGGGITAGVAF